MNWEKRLCNTALKVVVPVVMALICTFLTWAGGFNLEGDMAGYGLTMLWIVFWDLYEHKEDVKEVKGEIQYDLRGDRPAIQMMFYEDPMKIIEEKEVLFKVNDSAELID